MIIREILFVIFVATHVHENLCLATVNVNDTQENDLNFANNSKQLFDGGRRRKGGNSGNNVVIIEKDGDKGIGSLGLSDYFIELEDENVSGGKRKHGKRKQRKKSKGKKKLKKFMPIFLGLGGLKLLMYHFFIKKMAFFSFLSFILSKISFVLATLVALKHFFHTPQHQERTEKNKIEVVHIPFSKFRQGDRDIENDNYYEESQFIPVTFEAEPNVESTTSFNIDLPYNGRYRENSFISSEERYNENSQNQFAEDIFNRADKRSRHNLMNHVHSPFA